MIGFIDNKITCCNSCHTIDENTDIKTIIIRGEGAAGGTAVMLCKKCRKELFNLLKEDFKNGQ